MVSIMEKYKFKLIVVGSASVGKTSVIRRYIHNQPPGTYTATIGMELESIPIKLPEGDVTLHIWDTAGQETYKALTKSYFHGACLAIIMFDLTSRDSFEKFNSWLDLIRDNTSHDLPIFLAGNKLDLERERQISFMEGQAAGEREGLQRYIEVSAKSGVGIKELFESAAKLLIQNIRESSEDEDNFQPRVVGNKRKMPSLLLKNAQSTQKKDSKCC